MPTPRALQVGVRRRSSGTADAALAALVIAVVALMVVPLPTWLLDLLIATNLASSVAILLITLYVPDALGIAAFPTLLLITTLVRLSLNVSSTRLILLQANAGEVIQAFGNFVVRGNYVVGAVIFLILAIIQFIVIAKGSERVAEVGARFTLDAMPGKQMAIDAELRAGSIDGAEAKRRRRQLARESQFYGAMDGAMKFVKGDVIASFLITVINILGGLAIGVGQKHMDAVAALKRYGLLTIGDGLVTQIPALVLATAAGVLVTRVASEEPDTPLGEELGAQLLGAPRALRVASVFVFILAAIPGLPALPFVVIGALLFVASRARTQRLREAARIDPPEPVQRREGNSGPRFVPVVVPWTLEVAAELASFVEDDLRGDELKRAGLRSAGAAAQELIFRELGVPLPACRVEVSNELPERMVALSIHEVPARVFTIPDEVGPDSLAEHVLGEVMGTLRARAGDFLGIAETQALLDQLEQLAPATVRQVIPKPVSLTLLADILRRLVEEGISIRDLKNILESLAQVAGTDKDPLNLTEYVRSQLRRAITHELTHGSPELSVCVLDSQIEEAVRGAIVRTGAGSFLTLAPAAARDIVTAVRRALASAELPDPERPVVLTQPDVRRFVRKLLETDFPGLRAVSYAELLPELGIKPVARATLAGL
ncbi:MAG: flagellar biosynthesis protein FlhA [Sorangiineae bacterium]|nr:flagellar biosynthesis protein FlhA [Polyangiaceae bacterium]MEB2322792.1 flagellar biosynthesis protein FlhA [Sorangiineae bacterium]